MRNGYQNWLCELGWTGHLTSLGFGVSSSLVRKEDSISPRLSALAIFVSNSRVRADSLDNHVGNKWGWEEAEGHGRGVGRPTHWTAPSCDLMDRSWGTGRTKAMASQLVVGLLFSELWV